MSSKIRLGVSDATYLQPLLAGLDASDSPFELSSEFPAINSVRLNERTNALRCAFLSPIDYARYAGLYRIVPGVCVSSSAPTNTITLTVRQDVRNINRVAVDIRVTSEIVLAKIILLERLRNMPEDRSDIEFVPMLPSLATMLQKADAALIANLSPTQYVPSPHLTIDLVEEWSDMTGLPYVHGFWVAREDEFDRANAGALINARDRGIADRETIIRTEASKLNVPADDLREYFESFAYDFGQNAIDSVTEFVTMAYYHGVLGDVPDISFFDFSPAN